MDNEKTNRPVERLRIGRLSASIWDNQSANDDGKFYTVTIERRYRDGEGTWKTGRSFGRDDLLGVAKLADQAHTRILALQQREAESD